MPTEEEVLADLRAVADDLDDADQDDDRNVSPSTLDYREHGSYHLDQVYEHFDSWNDALEAAGLKPRSHPRKIPREALLDELRRLADEHGEPLTVETVDTHGAYAAATYQKRFDSWLAACREAGVETPTTSGASRTQIAREDLLAELKRLADVVDNSPPSSTEMREQGTYSAGVYTRRFGSWANACEEAGLDTPETSPWPIPRADLLAELERLADVVDNPPPSSNEMDEHGAYSSSTYESRFGSWANALEAAGFDPTEAEQKIPREDLLNELRRVADLVDDPPPSQSEMDEHGAYSAWTYKNRFGSWSNACEEAGLESAEPREKIPREDLLEELRRVADVVDKARPTQDDMREHGEYSAWTYRNRFGSWTSAREEALDDECERD